MALRIAVLVKPVPDPVVGGERLGPDHRLDRSSIPPVINGNDEYALEAALKFVDAGVCGEITIVAMAGVGGTDTIRKALAMGAHKGVLVTDDALAGTCTLSTARVLAEALRAVDADLVFAGVDSSDSAIGVVHAGVAAILGLPYLSYASKIEPDEASRTVRIRRISPTGYDLLEAPLPAMVVCTQTLGEPRYPSLKGIMGARSKPILTQTLADLGLEASAVGGAVATTRVLDVTSPPPRAATRLVREAPDEAARQVVEFLAERRII